MRRKDCFLKQNDIKKYVLYLKDEERSVATIEKYARDLTALYHYLGDRPVTKIELMEWKQQLCQTHAPASVNSMLAAVNGFLAFMGWKDLTIKPLKMQKTLFIDEKKELTRAEYVRLVRTAEHKENERLSLVIQTICATGIRVSELRFITAEAVYAGRQQLSTRANAASCFCRRSCVDC